MKPKIMYVENKTSGHSGLAWIGLVEFSKSGQTIYFNDLALKKFKTTGIWGNHYDIETGEEYWISGVKKNGEDRHKYGGGKIMIDKKVISDYLKIIDSEVLDERKFEIVDIVETNKARFLEIENAAND